MVAERPRALPWAGIGRTFGAEEIGILKGIVPEAAETITLELGIAKTHEILALAFSLMGVARFDGCADFGLVLGDEGFVGFVRDDGELIDFLARQFFEEERHG